MPRLAAAELLRIHEKLLFDGPEAGRKLSAFWVLLALSAIIASAGIVSDSTATVIGAMIVAPLMTPIIGTVFSVMSGDRGNLIRSLGLIVAGSLAVIAIGYLFGKLTKDTLDRENVAPVATKWAKRSGWQILSVTSSEAGVDVKASGGLPEPNPGLLQRDLAAAGLQTVPVVLELIPSRQIKLPIR